MQGLEWEMKSPSGKSKNTIGNQFIRAAKQSKYFIFDGRRTPISDADLEKSIRFEMTKRSSIKRVVFIQSWARWLKSNLKCDIFMISRETGQSGWAVKGVPCFFILGEFRKRNCFILF
jgi:hypothetical protein